MATTRPDADRRGSGSLRSILAKANERKTGDELAGIAADSDAERVAAKEALSRVSLRELRENPVVLTEIGTVSEDYLRARVVDPSGPFVVYAGQYQPEALAFLERAEPPTFVAVTGKARTFQPEDSNQDINRVKQRHRPNRKDHPENECVPYRDALRRNRPISGPRHPLVKVAFQGMIKSTASTARQDTASERRYHEADRQVRSGCKCHPSNCNQTQ
jgi:hypothetical protein